MFRMTISHTEDHPNYDSSILNYDFSLLKIKETVDFMTLRHIRPICLPREAINDYKNFVATVTGWGMLYSTSSSGSSVLMEVDVRVLSNFECQMKYEDDISSQMLCAGVDEVGKDSCQGDSGIY